MTDGPVVIYGTGGMGRETLDALARAGAEVAGFLTDDAPEHGGTCSGKAVLGGRDWLRDHPEARVVCAVGDPRGRAALAAALEARGARFATAIHPRATVSSSARVGAGCIIGAGAVVSTDVRLGAHVIVNLNATISHDATLEDFATLAPGVHLAGHVTVGRLAALGTGAVVLPRTSVGRGCVIGAGAVVTRAVADDSVMAGVPARLHRTLP